MAESIIAKSGIYSITNIINGKRYVGSSKNLRYRFNKHTSQLTQNTHHSAKLQNAWNKYGPSNFLFETLELVFEEKYLIAREQFWLENFNSSSKKGYNICSIAYSCLGVKRSIETRKKMSAWQFGKVFSEATKEKMSHANLGKKHKQESKLKMSKSRLGNKWRVGITHTDEAKIKISNSLLGNKYSLGFKHSLETKQKHSFNNSGSKNASAIQVIEITTGRIFGCTREASEAFDISYNSLRGHLHRNQGVYEMNGLKFVRQYDQIVS